MGSNLISGLIKQRTALYREAEAIRDRECELRLDIHALDRTLRSLGHEGDLEAQMPRRIKQVRFKRGELSTACFKALREAGTPQTTRQVAEAVLAARGEELTHIRMNTFAKACAKSMGNIAARGRLVRGENADGEVVWERIERVSI